MQQFEAHSLKRNTLGTKDLVLLVLAAVAPMGIVVSLTALSIALGKHLPLVFLHAPILGALGFVSTSAPAVAEP
jgi:hypothetical protein